MDTVAVQISFYFSCTDESILVCFGAGRSSTYEIYRVDSSHNGELMGITDNLCFEMELFSMVLIKEK